jgi:serine protease AprX
MQRTHAFKQLVALLGALVLALPFVVVPASAAPAASRLDDDLSQRLQTTPESQLIPVIIEGAVDTSRQTSSSSDRAERAESRVRGTGGHVVGSSRLLGATVAELTPAQIRVLAADLSIARIHVDAAVKANALGPDASASGPTPIVFQQTVGAMDAWRAGQSGQGVTVAVLDTGIDNDSVAFGARVKARVDLVDPAHPAAGDPAGHGSHVAGIIAAGRAFPSPGIAPDASLVSVRVLDENGHGRVSSVVLGLEWVIAHRASMGIRVVVMALGAPAVIGYRDDPLASAAELAWRSGLVVVTPAGNDGPGVGTVQTPGIDPLVVTVGASDDRGTPSPADDTLPTWSSVGPTPDGLAKPDLLAPGRKIVSVRVPYSTVELQSPSHIEGPTTIRFSGTSEATGVVGGAAALLLQQRPDLTPDQTKALLTNGAVPIAGVSAAAQGAGLLNVMRSMAARTPHVSRPHLPPANALIRTMLPALSDQAGRDSIDADQLMWDRLMWDQLMWDRLMWDRLMWDQLMWDQLMWDRLMWDKLLWDQAIFD